LKTLTSVEACKNLFDQVLKSNQQDLLEAQAEIDGSNLEIQTIHTDVARKLNNDLIIFSQLIIEVLSIHKAPINNHLVNEAIQECFYGIYDAALLKQKIEGEDYSSALDYVKQMQSKGCYTSFTSEHQTLVENKLFLFIVNTIKKVVAIYLAKSNCLEEQLKNSTTVHSTAQPTMLPHFTTRRDIKPMVPLNEGEQSVEPIAIILTKAKV
jgi:hypothetical protein